MNRLSDKRIRARNSSAWARSAAGDAADRIQGTAPCGAP